MDQNKKNHSSITELEMRVQQVFDESASGLSVSEEQQLGRYAAQIPDSRKPKQRAWSWIWITPGALAAALALLVAFHLPAPVEHKNLKKVASVQSRVVVPRDSEESNGDEAAQSTTTWSDEELEDMALVASVDLFGIDTLHAGLDEEEQLAIEMAYDEF
ncbi:MAG: hypothetical protein IPJ88_05980 [Myxococcales bacterium]|nr:MAG: hypothetical protein IPJ88_05980 [Myxococcales bacterium]